jgi:hypothetical protein
MPVDITVECNEVPVAPAIVTASDNCDQRRIGRIYRSKN